MPPPRTQNPPTVGAVEGLEVQSGATRLDTKNTPLQRTRGDYARERYALDSQIKMHLRADAQRIAPEKHPANVHRTIGCTWIRIAPIALIRPKQVASYHYKGLSTCGCVHSCPLCASKIQQRRRIEVGDAIEYADTVGKSVVMVSYTFPHRIDQPLSLLLRLQQQAIKHLRGSRGYAEIMRSIGHVGRIRSLEVTHGDNGWHPHTHELLIVGDRTESSRLRFPLTKLWFQACRSGGLYREERDSEAAFFTHAVDVREGDEAAGDYIAKLDDQRAWDLSDEMTKSASKQGRRSGRHPFKLAALATTSALFIEYVHAMKGQRQLVWSRGLKALVGVSEKTDEEIASEEATRIDDRIPLSDQAWRVVRGNDARWEILEAAGQGGAPAVKKYLHDLGHGDGGDQLGEQ